MSIRLNKALRELNIGLQTAVEFLEKRSDLGEVKAEPSFKLNDKQYEALNKAFKQDAEVRSEAEKLFQKKPKEKKRSNEQKSHHAEDFLKSDKPQQKFTPLGKIDLDSIGKKPTAKSAAPEHKETSPKQAAAVSQASVNNAAPKAPESKVTETPKAQKVEQTQSQESEAPKAQSAVHTQPVAQKQENSASTPKPVEQKNQTPVEKKPVENKLLLAISSND